MDKLYLIDKKAHYKEISFTLFFSWYMYVSWAHKEVTKEPNCD